MTRCQKCGTYKDAKGIPYHDPESICYTFELPDGHPEPNGDHEWEHEDCARCGAAAAIRDEDGNFTYPQEQYREEEGAGYCGYCAREEGFRI